MVPSCSIERVHHVYDAKFPLDWCDKEGWQEEGVMRNVAKDPASRSIRLLKICW